ncbi:MAG: hypothetical protein HC889_15845, partial [Synechococcaceae cyanobacterium SM1_2_3]|nr:hypothetical protein [Synechococcaceae cyanobacterium SM1_2_3]
SSKDISEQQVHGNWTTFIQNNYVQANPNNDPDISSKNKPWQLLQAGLGFSPSTGNPNNADYPNAYLKYIFYDTDGNYVRSGIAHVTAAHQNSWMIYVFYHKSQPICNMPKDFEQVIVLHYEPDQWIMCFPNQLG